MAIYTQYGRYIKAKLFKEMLESAGSTYMLFGIGNGSWDDSTQQVQTMPIASYNTSSLLIDESQFKDEHACQYFVGAGQDGNGFTAASIMNTLSNGVPIDDTFIQRCKELIPPFPCVWHYSANDYTVMPYTTGEIKQSDYHKHFILYEGSNYNVYKLDPNAISPATPVTQVGTVSIQGLADQYKQYFAELYLRGLAIKNNPGYLAPVGLLGAVKCGVSFVKDIGSVENYTGNANQFWYGDRYWEIVDPLDSNVDNYINPISDSDNSTSKVGQDYYPHHLLVTATINPRQLCKTLAIDQFIIPRQIAICTKPTPSSEDKAVYSVDEYMFNFGQLNTAFTEGKSNVLNFTLPCTVGGNTYPNGDFKFVLHDYIHGTDRNKNVHTVNRFGYVIGF